MPVITSDLFCNVDMAKPFHYLPSLVESVFSWMWERLGKVLWAHKMKVIHRWVRKNVPDILFAAVIKYTKTHIEIVISRKKRKCHQKWRMHLWLEKHFSIYLRTQTCYKLCPGCVVNFRLPGLSHTAPHNVTERHMTKLLWSEPKHYPSVCTASTACKIT